MARRILAALVCAVAIMAFYLRTGRLPTTRPGLCTELDVGAVQLDDGCVQACSTSEVALGYKTSLKDSTPLCLCPSHADDCTPLRPPFTTNLRALIRPLLGFKTCPPGRIACPVGSSSILGSFVCVDTAHDSQNCGVCGHDCSRVPGVAGSGCFNGQCRPGTCRPGYHLDIVRQTCVKDSAPPGITITIPDVGPEATST